MYGMMATCSSKQTVVFTDRQRWGVWEIYIGFNFIGGSRDSSVGWFCYAESCVDIPSSDVRWFDIRRMCWTRFLFWYLPTETEEPSSSDGIRTTYHSNKVPIRFRTSQRVQRSWSAPGCAETVNEEGHKTKYKPLSTVTVISICSLNLTHNSLAVKTVMGTLVACIWQNTHRQLRVSANEAMYVAVLVIAVR
jgi:hypothetical protein